MADLSQFSQFEEDMDIIQKLGDKPGSDNDMSSADLKAEFDKGGNLLKTFLNGMVVQLNAVVDLLNNASGGNLFTGGTMAGPLNMNKQKLSGLNTPTADDQAANKSYVDSALDSAKEYTDGKHGKATATLSSSGWSSSAPYTQTVTVAGVLATDSPHVSAVYDSNLETALSQQDAWSMVSKAAAGGGSITFTCFEDKPSVDIPIQVEVNR